MVSRYPTPIPVRKSVYAKWWKVPAWQQMHCSNAGNNLGVVIGGNGTGKSWLLGSVAEDLGWDHRGEQSLFNTDYLWEHLAFDTKSASLIMKELIKLPRNKTIGYQFILDEGQLSLYSKDAFQEEVKNLSRMLMTVRSRRWGVYINLPSFMHLNKDVRMITNWLVWMKGKPTDFSFGTFYNVEANMYDGEPYLKKPVFNDTIESLDGLKIAVSSAYNILPFPKPSKKFIKPYEKMKSEHQKEIFIKFADEISAKQEVVDSKTEKEKEYDEFANMVVEDHNRFWDVRRNTYSVVGIMRGLAVTRDKAVVIIGKALKKHTQGFTPNNIYNNNV
jgi:hypothetical protein